jgi:hypothetical protein
LSTAANARMDQMPLYNQLDSTQIRRGRRLWWNTHVTQEKKWRGLSEPCWPMALDEKQTHVSHATDEGEFGQVDKKTVVMVGILSSEMYWHVSSCELAKRHSCLAT